jgi:hypothetical protein
MEITMRLPELSPMQHAEEIYYGQIVIFWARWFVILAAAVLALWSTDSTGHLARRAIMVVGLMALNFVLHGRFLAGKPANALLLAATSIADVTIIGGMIAFWSPSGVHNQLYVLYYPVLFSASLVLAPRIAAAIGGFTAISYVVLCILAGPSISSNAEDAKAVVIRVITLGATVGLGAYYWRSTRRNRVGAIAPLVDMEAARVSAPLALERLP